MTMQYTQHARWLMSINIINYLLIIGQLSILHVDIFIVLFLYKNLYLSIIMVG